MTGAVADQLLNPNAAQQVQGILGMPLRVASTWADCVKDVKHPEGDGFVYTPTARYHAACVAFETPEGESRMVDYATRNWDNCNPGPKDPPCHNQYHYTDIAIQHKEYKAGFIGTSDHDIVSAINAAIAVLQDQPAPAPFSIKDKEEALLMLAHLVGDLHQPLHVGAVYIDAQDHPTNPDAAGHHPDPKTEETQGGNYIFDGKAKLHGEWDDVSTSFKPDHLTIAMLKSAKAVPPTPGDVTTWAQVWASDTVVVSHAALKGITYTGSQPHWAADFGDRNAYLAKKRQIQSAQLAKGGAHLAQLLNAIWP